MDPSGSMASDDSTKESKSKKGHAVDVATTDGSEHGRGDKAEDVAEMQGGDKRDEEKKRKRRQNVAGPSTQLSENGIVKEKKVKKQTNVINSTVKSIASGGVADAQQDAEHGQSKTSKASRLKKRKKATKTENET